MYQAFNKKNIVQKVRIWLNENSERHIHRGEKMNMAMELQVSIEKLENLIRNEIRRKNLIRKKNRYGKEFSTRKLKFFFTQISAYPRKEDIYNLSQELKMDTIKIIDWFKNERKRQRRDNLLKKAFSLKN
jgi:hypothetical protein